MIVSQRAEMGEAGFQHYLQRQAQVRQQQAAQAELAKARRSVESEENAHAWQALHTFARLPAELAAEPLYLLLPSGPKQLRALSKARRERYRAHLTEAALDAAAMPYTASTQATNDDSDVPASTSSMPGRLCALCGGGCCTRGLDHAYLSPATLRRFMDSETQLSPEQVVDAYLDRVTGATQSGSCINHTRAGCSLPRAMRSDICNDFACASLAQVQAAPQEQVVLIVRRKQDQWHRDAAVVDNAINGAALLRETGVVHMPLG